MTGGGKAPKILTGQRLQALQAACPAHQNGEIRMANVTGLTNVVWSGDGAIRPSEPRDLFPRDHVPRGICPIRQSTSAGAAIAHACSRDPMVATGKTA